MKKTIKREIEKFISEKNMKFGSCKAFNDYAVRLMDYVDKQDEQSLKDFGRVEASIDNKSFTLEAGGKISTIEEWMRSVIKKDKASKSKTKHQKVIGKSDIEALILKDIENGLFYNDIIKKYGIADYRPYRDLASDKWQGVKVFDRIS